MAKARNVIRNKLGRKPIGKKAAPLFALRLPDEITRDVKAYAKAEGIKHQGEALRRLIKEALEKRKAP
jgi:hypothetical protein